MTIYLTFEDIVGMHGELIREHGGKWNLRDAAALHAAVARPQSGYYNDLVEEAAALFESLSQNHPFIDGNKRTAMTATAVFLELNGRKLQFEDDAAYGWIIGLYESGRMNKKEIESWLRDHISAVEAE